MRIVLQKKVQRGEAISVEAISFEIRDYMAESSNNKDWDEIIPFMDANFNVNSYDCMLPGVIRKDSGRENKRKPPKFVRHLIRKGKKAVKRIGIMK